METTAPPSSSTIARTSLLILRVLTFVLLLIALILIAINKGTEEIDQDLQWQLKFNNFLSYRYMVAAIVIGFAYNIFQMVLSIFNVISGNRMIRGRGGYLLDFYGDKGTGAAAGYGASQDVQRVVKFLLNVSFDKFFGMANASASLLLLAFLLTAIASVLTSYALPKKA
ncbi:CASP-like protein 4D1 [Senna tora]|uniref:CASP-like protein n=1 Tax=Senna tora TaxID=362788 RepID=A0A834W6Q1_9FABA|nr:CASP-like protein 4D1 [Senna tora]